MKQQIFRRRAPLLMVATLGLTFVSACDRTDATRTAADNTARNVRDRDEKTPTPMDQGGSEADRAITQYVRQSVLENDSLSTNAHNVKVITQDGVVTLRGPVQTAAEKATIVAVAHRAPGVTRVDDQIEVQATN